jgi:hypothetical protein
MPSRQERIDRAAAPPPSTSHEALFPVRYIARPVSAPPTSALLYNQVHQQQQVLPYHQQLHMNNGLNGGQLPGMAFPTPAGHTAELNYIHAMVEELSRQLAENKRVLEDVVTGVGRVRNRARAQQLGNEELITGAADELGGELRGLFRLLLDFKLTWDAPSPPVQETNMDALVSMLTEALEKAKYSRDANAALLGQYATVLSSMLKQFHDYKAQHIADVSAWHRNYRTQLAEARAENSRLREQIWDMQAHAGVANESLRTFRKKYEEDEARWEKRVDSKSARQELRFWRRMAMPWKADDDPCWSDDDDLIDPNEKVRLREIQTEIEKRRAQEQLAGVGASVGSDGAGSEEGEPPQTPEQQRSFIASFLGGVAMERDDSGPPVPPPRPSSAASTGSSGQMA